MVSWQPSVSMLRLLLFVRIMEMGSYLTASLDEFHLNSKSPSLLLNRSSHLVPFCCYPTCKQASANLAVCWTYNDRDRQYGHVCRFCVTTGLQGGQNVFSDSEIVMLEPLGGLCIRNVSASRKRRCCGASQSGSVSAESLSHSHFTFAIKGSARPASFELDSFFFLKPPLFSLSENKTAIITVHAASWSWWISERDWELWFL